MPDLALPGSLVVLGAVLVAVVRSPGGRTEATWSVPAAALVVASFGLFLWAWAFVMAPQAVQNS